MATRSKILIVDDEPFNVDYLEQELEDLGYHTISAINGPEALQKVTAEAPDLILLDVMMPIMDGITVCRILKENEETRLIPIIIMTALDGMDDRIDGIQAGADDFLTKPVDRRELLARIQTSLKLKHSVDRKIGELRLIKDHFAKFVPEAVKRLVVANSQAPGLENKHERDVSALFVDISGYTRMSEQLSLAALNEIVERYFSVFLDRICEAGGDMNETTGDGFLAIFHDLDRQKHATQAVDTALSLLAATDTLNQESDKPALAIHMGLASGTALVGSARFEGQRGTRWIYTASGPVINLAARLADIAEAGQIVIDPGMVQRLAEGYRSESLGLRQLRNIAEPVHIYRILGPSEAA
jgi:CheY-like chemotaxis protein/class 3 adenylate cyclase